MLKTDLKIMMELKDIMVWNMLDQKSRGTYTEQQTKKGLHISRAELYRIYHCQIMGCVT